MIRTPRKLADRIGVDPYDVSLPMLREDAKEWRRPRQSRFWFRSPCWANATVDFLIHLLLPSMVVERYPRLAAFLGRHSPRWAERPVVLLVQNNRASGYRRRPVPDGERPAGDARRRNVGGQADPDRRADSAAGPGTGRRSSTGG